MPTRLTAPLGAPCWVDLMTSDTDRSRAFYSELFGWSAEEPSAEFGGYFTFTKDGAAVAGCMARQEETQPDVWSVYLATDDAAKIVERAEAHGGGVHVPPMAVADLGTMAVLADAGGAAVGIWQPGTFPGLQVLGETGTASWFELHTRNYEAALAFYRDVFRWDTATASDTPELRYTTMTSGGEWLAGIMDAAGFLPAGVADQWSVYFAVEDADAALTRIVALGGSVVLAAEDTPYGRLATAADPNGAIFKVVAPNESMPAKE